MRAEGFGLSPHFLYRSRQQIQALRLHSDVVSEFECSLGVTFTSSDVFAERPAVKILTAKWRLYRGDLKLIRHLLEV